MREMGAAPLKNTGKKMRKIRKFATLAKARIPDIDCIFGVLSAMEALPDFKRACCRQISTPPSEWSWTETVDEFTNGQHGTGGEQNGRERKSHGCSRRQACCRDDTSQARNCIGLLSLVWMEHQPHSRQHYVQEGKGRPQQGGNGSRQQGRLSKGCHAETRSERQ
jgi:hypothetical protein